MEYQCSVRQLVEAMREVNPKAKITLKDGAAPEEATLGGTPEPVLDTSSLQKELKWQPKYSLKEATKRYFNYFRQQAGLPLL